MACADADTLAALVANALSEAERAAIAIHAAGCEACHALLDGLLTDGIRDTTFAGRYVIGERLGAGGMGVVYAAVDSELQRRVAVKVLRPDGTGELGTQGRERLMREARVLASLSHPNVVTVFDIGAHDGDLFLAMELVEGGSLKAWLRAAPRTTAEIVDRLIDAGRGLAAAHAAGVVHRDVKPDNILVGKDSRARVTDFGLARLDGAVAEPPTPGSSPQPTSSDLTRTGTRIGTPVYMAPEQQAGTAEARTDQWSFCAMIYELFAGMRPFPDDLDARAAAIAAGRLAPGKPVPKSVMRIVTRGLRAHPDERWPSMDAVVDALVRGRRRRGRVWIGAGILALVLASLAFVIGPFATRRESATPWPEVRLIDERPGCNCPMSACANGCVGVCRASDITMGAPVPGVSLPGRQEALVGASSDGESILYLAGKQCMVDHLFLARRRGATYESVDLTAKLDLARVKVFEGCCSLASSGRFMIMARPDRHGFVRVRLDGSSVLPIDGSDDLGVLAPDTRGIRVEFPVMSPDELTLYYRIYDHATSADDQGPLDGVFASQRASTTVPFEPGTRLPGRARYYDIVTGVSADHLSLFMSAEYRTHVLVRASVDKPFLDPGLNMLPSLFFGWRSIPLADCNRILTTYTPGGCAAEDIVFLDAK